VKIMGDESPIPEILIETWERVLEAREPTFWDFMV
jgi:hypothetical protein